MSGTGVLLAAGWLAVVLSAVADGREPAIGAGDGSGGREPGTGAGRPKRDVVTELDVGSS